MRYEFKLMDAQATIGFCACVPEQEMSVTAMADYLKEHPLDEYMHKHLLSLVLEMDEVAVAGLKAQAKDNPALGSVLAEAEEIQGSGDTEAAQALAGHSPLVDLRQSTREGTELHRIWSQIFQNNVLEHKALPDLTEAEIDLPCHPDEIEASTSGFVGLADLPALKGKRKKAKPVPIAETTRRAEKALRDAGVQMSQQMRHQQSLAPVGLVRKWRRNVEVTSGGLSYSLFGEHTSFGRGLEFETAQVTLIMEIVERYSSWASVDAAGVLERRHDQPLTLARRSELGEGESLDPNAFPVEAVYEDEPLYWLSCQRPDGSDVLAPAQMVYLFLNLDEQAFFSGLGSTGLGAGNTMAQARRTALLEVIERDSETTAPFVASRCFRIESRDKAVADVLEQYRSKGIDVLFEDITSELGVPCYRAHAVGPEGQVVKGASASLSGPRACVSAMLEVPYPFPFGPPSTPGPKDLEVRVLEDLPDYDTGSFEGDVALLEAVLKASGRVPAYADLTREDMGIPVCRALIPGLELMADFDRYSRLSPRLFARAIQGQQKT